MKFNLNLISFFILGIMVCSQAFSQRDTIDSDRLIIVKQYSPTVNDAFKIKQKPSEKDTIKQQRKSVNYSFIDVPVASTFTPAKGTASGVRMASPEKLYQSYARLGAGNYSTLIADFLTNFDISLDRNMDVKFSHISSQGGIDDVVLDDDFLDTSLRLNLTSTDRYFDWNFGIDLNHREVNYYGIQPSFRSNLPETTLNSIDPLQSYTKLEAFAGVKFYEDIFREAEIKVYNFSDNYSSSEQYFQVQPFVEVPIRDQKLFIEGDFSFLNGKFRNSFFDRNSVDYLQFQAGINPFMDFNFDNINLKVGAKAVFLGDFEASSSDVFFYPDLNAEFLLNQETIKINLGVNGGLQQNTFENFTQSNPFVSPTLLIKPSNQQYNAFAGFSTKLLDNVSLSAQANYSSTKDYAFFRANPTLENRSASPVRRNFDYQNSFDVLYADLDVFSLSADLAYQIDSNLNLGFFGKYSNFSPEEGQEAWNLPSVELKAYADYKFTKNWNFSASLFYVGERKDVLESTAIRPGGVPDPSGMNVNTVDGYLDLNASVEYKIIPRLTAFVNANNLLNNSYNRWQNFEVQGFQILGGLIYQFDW